MISKEQLIDIWQKYYNSDAIPDNYKYLFTDNGFYRLVAGTFCTDEERDIIIKHTHSIYGSRSLTKEYVDAFKWDEEHWKGLLKSCIIFKLTKAPCNFDKDDTILGILQLLDVHSSDIQHIEEPNYKKFYNGTKYGYFNLPLIIDIARYFNFDISEYLDKISGFVSENEVPKFDMNNWPDLFKNSKQITTLKDSVTDGRMLTVDDFALYDDSETFDHFKIETDYYPYAEKMWMIHEVMGKFIPLRKVYTGSGFVEELIPDYGWLAGFYQPSQTPVYKINTVQGFSFYVLGSDWYGGVYIDDISIKKIKFITQRSVNKDIDIEKRIFVIYNEETGYWRLPELNYPKIYKNFVKEIIKKNKDKVGKWDDTHVFASSRTLNSIIYGTDMYPDVKSKNDFISNIVNNAANIALRQLKLDNRLKSLGLKIEVKFDADKFDFENSVKPIDLTQEEIDSYCRKNDTLLNKDTFEITKY